MNIALIGYGKMGKAIEQIALNGGHSISHKVYSPESLAALLENKPDLAIEFTQPESAVSNITFCLESNIPVISGTTGWQDDYHKVANICKEREGTFLYASNFSIGVNLFFEFNKWIASKMNHMGFTPSMTEIHHTEKKDSPSGTAITLADDIISQNDQLNSWTNEESTDHKKLGIVSERIPNVPGTHIVSYSSKLESIEMTHTAHDRSVFAEGVMKVAEWIHTRKGVFKMTDYINS
ncbi:MAG: 4-hydroxy-tetrahydrodipicolinate reductase [Ekhidna sp.]